VCAGWLSLTATRCACGYDSATGDVTEAIQSCRRDRRVAGRTLASGIASAGVLTALLSVSTCRDALGAGDDDRVQVGIVVLLFLALIYGVFRGVSLMLAVGRRSRVLRSLQQLPPARVVDRRG
jgi:hypothetical protein